MSKVLTQTLMHLNETVQNKTALLGKRIEQLETKSAPLKLVETKSLGESIAESDQVKGFLKKTNSSGRIKITQHEIKTAIIGNNHLQNDPLTFTSQPPIAPLARRKLFLRDLLFAGKTDQGAVEHPIQLTHTDNTGVQVGGSPEAFQNVALGESSITFDLSFQPVITIGTFIHTSRQVLEDSEVLNSFLTNTLFYSLRLAEENEILNGTNANGRLNGLLTAATAYTVASPNLTTASDKIRDMILQLDVADFSATAIVIHPIDWFAIEIATTTASDARNMSSPTLWGLPVVVTRSIASGTALVGDFIRAATLFDRQDPEFLFSYHNNDNYEKNMVTLKIDERVSLVVTNPLGLVTGSI